MIDQLLRVLLLLAMAGTFAMAVASAMGWV